MGAVKFSSKIDKKTLAELKLLAKETKRNISGIITDAVAEYISRARVRPAFKEAVDAVISENRALLKKLAE